MNEIHFGEKLRDICGAFGKAYPATHVCNSIFRRIKELPDGFMDYAAERLENQPDLPRNLGYHLRHVLWPEYLDKNPGLRAPEENKGCKFCAPGIPGFFWAYESNGKSYMLKCCCNQRRDLEHLEGWTPAMAEARGLLLVDPTHRQGQQHMPAAARAAIGYNEKPRPAHVREREYVGTASW